MQGTTEVQNIKPETKAYTLVILKSIFQNITEKYIQIIFISLISKFKNSNN